MAIRALKDMLNGWQRKEYNTGGADPTCVVEWIKGDFKVTQFQNVYVASIGGKDVHAGNTTDVAKAIYEILEEAWTEVELAREEAEHYFNNSLSQFE